MRRSLVALVLLMLAQLVAANTVYLNCPALFPQTNNSITANYYAGNPPAASCSGLALYIDGSATTVSSTCPTGGVQGLWTFNFNVTSNGVHNVTAIGSNATATCFVEKVAFTSQVSIPEMNPAAILFVVLGVIFVLRRKK